MMPRQRSTILCTEEEITGYSWSNEGRVTVEVSFGFTQDDGTFFHSPLQNRENYSIDGADFKAFQAESEEAIGKEALAELMWKYVDKTRNLINTQRRIAIHDSSNTQH